MLLRFATGPIRGTYIVHPSVTSTRLRVEVTDVTDRLHRRSPEAKLNDFKDEILDITESADKQQIIEEKLAATWAKGPFQVRDEGQSEGRFQAKLKTVAHWVGRWQLINFSNLHGGHWLRYWSSSLRGNDIIYTQTLQTARLVPQTL